MGEKIKFFSALGFEVFKPTEVILTQERKV